MDLAGREPASDIYGSSLEVEDSAWLYESHQAIQTCLSRHMWLQQAGPKLPLEVPCKSSKVNTGLECMTLIDWANPIGSFGRLPYPTANMWRLPTSCSPLKLVLLLHGQELKSPPVCLLLDHTEWLQVTHIMKDVFVEGASLALCINLSPAAIDFREETLQLLEELSLPLKQHSSAPLRYELMLMATRM